MTHPARKDLLICAIYRHSTPKPEIMSIPFIRRFFIRGLLLRIVHIFVFFPGFSKDRIGFRTQRQEAKTWLKQTDMQIRFLENNLLFGRRIDNFLQLRPSLSASATKTTGKSPRGNTSFMSRRSNNNGCRCFGSHKDAPMRFDRNDRIT